MQMCRSKKQSHNMIECYVVTLFHLDGYISPSMLYESCKARGSEKLFFMVK